MRNHSRPKSFLLGICTLLSKRAARFYFFLNSRINSLASLATKNSWNNTWISTFQHAYVRTEKCDKAAQRWQLSPRWHVLFFGIHSTNHGLYVASKVNTVGISRHWFCCNFIHFQLTSKQNTIYISYFMFFLLWCKSPVHSIHLLQPHWSNYGTHCGPTSLRVWLTDQHCMRPENELRHHRWPSLPLPFLRAMCLFLNLRPTLLFLPSSQTFPAGGRSHTQATRDLDLSHKGAKQPQRGSISGCQWELNEKT